MAEIVVVTECSLLTVLLVVSPMHDLWLCAVFLTFLLLILALAVAITLLVVATGVFFVLGIVIML